MIKVVLFKKQGEIRGFNLSGHADFADIGHDIVCSAVTSSVNFVCNAITEILKVKVNVNVNENEVSLLLSDTDMTKEVSLFLEAFCLNIQNITADYPENLNIQIIKI